MIGYRDCLEPIGVVLQTFFHSGRERGEINKPRANKCLCRARIYFNLTESASRVDKKNHVTLSELRLAWLATSRRRKRTIISVILLSFVIGSSITIGATIGQFPTWVSALSSSSSPGILLSYQKTAPIVGLLPANSTVPLSDLGSISTISGVSGVTPLIIEDQRTSLSSNTPSLIVGLDVNFWQLSLGLNSGHWPQPNSSEAVIAVASNTPGAIASSLTIDNRDFQVVGVALTSDLVLVNSIVISYATAQTLFGLTRSTSVFLIQTSSVSDPNQISSEISQVDPSLATVDLSSSAQVLNTVSRIVGSISGTVVFIEALFAFAIITTLTISSINSRRWEYGLISSYGGRRSVLRMILEENWIIFALAALPALLIGVGVLGYFTYYFNVLFGNTINASAALNSALRSMANYTTLLNYISALVAATLGSILAIWIVLPRILAKALTEQQA
jgi:hypothetical protein